MIPEQKTLMKELSTVLDIFSASEGALRPHFILTGPSGTGKSHVIATLAEKHDLGFLEINAAQLTKEGTSGNSLSKALAPLTHKQGQLTVCFVDEFDKLFIAGNSNHDLAHEVTHGVQNEFLRVLEADTTSVFGDYGKYVNIGINNVLFVFAGAFNGEEEIDLDRLRDFGVKTEFLGRVGLVFNTQKISLNSLLEVLEHSTILHHYLKLFPKVSKDTVVQAIGQYLADNYEKNTLGIRMINNLVNQYFIKGGKLGNQEAKTVTFQRTLEIH